MDLADTQYLKSNVGDALALGMAEVMMMNPQDPVQALGLYLLKYADTVELQAKSSSDADRFLTEDAAAAVRRAEEDARAEAEAAEGAVHASDEEREKAARKALLQSVHDQALSPVAQKHEDVFNLDGFLADLVQALAEQLSQLDGGNGPAVQVHLARAKATGAAGDDGAPSERIEYLASTQASFMLDSVLQSGQGVTADVFAIPPYEEPVDETPIPDDETDEQKAEREAAAEAARVARGPPPLPQLHLPNVLMDARAHRVQYFGKRRAFGAYTAVAIKYPSALLLDSIRATAEALNDPSVADQLEAKRAELDGTKATAETKLALCFDTVGQNRDFTPNQLAVIQSSSQFLMAEIKRRDTLQFWAEVDAERANLTNFAPLAAADPQAELDQAKAELPADASPEVVEFTALRSKVTQQPAIVEAINEWAHVSLPRGALAVYQAVLLLLGYQAERILHPRTSEPDWKRIRSNFNEQFFADINALSPEDEQANYPVEQINKLLEGATLEDARKASLALGELYRLVQSALKLQAAAVARRRAIKEAQEAEEAARKQAEAEAAAAAAAAAAAEQPPAEE